MNQRAYIKMLLRNNFLEKNLWSKKCVDIYVDRGRPTRLLFHYMNGEFMISHIIVVMAKIESNVLIKEIFRTKCPFLIMV